MKNKFSKRLKAYIKSAREARLKSFEVRKSESPAVERRFASELQIEEVKTDNGVRNRLVGYAAVFDSESVPLRFGDTEFREKVQPGAFKKDLDSGKDVRAFIGHDAKSVIGRRSANTLKLKEDGRGLRVEIDLPDTTEARDLKENMRVGNIDGMSFGFMARAGGDSFEKRGDKIIRTLHDVELFEVSVVSIPAYNNSSAQLRSLENFLNTEKQSGSEETARAETRWLQQQGETHKEG